MSYLNVHCVIPRSMACQFHVLLILCIIIFLAIMLHLNSFRSISCLVSELSMHPGGWKPIGQHIVCTFQYHDCIFCISDKVSSIFFVCPSQGHLSNVQSDTN